MSLDEDNIALGRWAIELRYLDQNQASQVLNECRKSGVSFLSVAFSWNLLDRETCGLLERRLHGSRERRISSHSDGMPLPSEGQELDGYIIEDLLGRGGMGAVFRARKVGGGGELQRFAIKFILTRDETARARFKREAEAVAAVDRHPNVVSIKSYATWNGCPYLVFDYVEGQNLEELMKAKRYTLREATQIVESIAKALHHIHNKGVLHRDLKPANILIRAEDGQVFLTDFGLARGRDSQTLTQSQDMLGTPHYMSPEQAGAEHETVGPETDIWALGVIYYELVTGVKPFDGGTGMELVTKILFSEPRRPGSLNSELPSTVDAVILKALRKAPEQRYRSGLEFAEENQRILLGESVLASRALPFSGIAGRVRRALGWKGLLVTVCSLLVILGALGFWVTTTQADAEAAAFEQQVLEAVEGVEKSDFKGYPGLLAGRLMTFVGQGPLPGAKKGFGDGTEKVFELRELSRKAKETERQGLFFECVPKKTWSEWNSAATVLAALESRKGGTPSLPKAWGAWLSGAKALQGGDRERAKGFFEGAASSSGALGSLGQFGLALCDLEQDPEAALAIFQRLETRGDLKDEGFQRAVAFMSSESFMEYHAGQLTSPRLSRADLTRLQKGLEERGLGAEEWERFHRRLSERFRTLSEKNIGSAALVYRRLRGFPRSLSGFRCPEPSAALHRELARRARREGQFAKALYHQLEMQKLDPETTEGVLKNEDLAKMVIDAGIVKNDLDEAYLITLEVSRAGCYLPYMRDGWREILDEKGILDREVKKAPDDPYARFWRAMTTVEDRTKYRERLDDAAFVLAHPRTREHFKAVMLTRRARLWRDSAIHLHGVKGEKIREAYARSRADLEKALSMKHPTPDNVYRELCMMDESLPKALQTKDVTARWVRYAQRWLEEVDDRYDRTEKGTLGEERDPDGPRLIMALGGRQRLRSNAQRMLGDAYLAHGDYDKAIEAARTSIRLDPASSPKKLSNWAPKTLIRALLKAKREDEARRELWRLAKQGRKAKDIRKLRRIWLEFGLIEPEMTEGRDGE